jgi:hypothetical protein
MAPVIRVDHSIEQHGVVGMQLLADHFQAEVIQPAERRQVSRAEGSVTHEPRAQPLMIVRWRLVDQARSWSVTW